MTKGQVFLKPDINNGMNEHKKKTGKQRALMPGVSCLRVQGRGPAINGVSIVIIYKTNIALLIVGLVSDTCSIKRNPPLRQTGEPD